MIACPSTFPHRFAKFEAMNAQTTQNDRNCPSCGRFVGPYEICPHCQASMENRVQLKTVKLIAVLGAIIGLVLLWTGVRLREVPTVQIGAIDLQYNMALARIEGTALKVTVDELKDTFRITIDDDTGRMTLNGFGKYTRFKEAMGDTFPQQGDHIAAIGNLSISENWGTSMFLASPRRLQLIERRQLKSLSLGTITRKELGLTTTLTGRITDIRTFKSGQSLTLDDGTGTMALTVFDSEKNDLPADIVQALETTGTTIEFKAKIDAYRNKLQLRLVNPGEPGNITVVNMSGGE